MFFNASLGQSPLQAHILWLQNYSTPKELSLQHGLVEVELYDYVVFITAETNILFLIDFHPGISHTHSNNFPLIGTCLSIGRKGWCTLSNLLLYFGFWLDLNKLDCTNLLDSILTNDLYFQHEQNIMWYINLCQWGKIFSNK